MTETPILYYDDSCRFCRALAFRLENALPHDWALQKLEKTTVFNWRSRGKLKLKVTIGGDTLYGHEAWELILSSVPIAADVLKLAERIGLRNSSITFVRQSLGLARRLCYYCKNR